MKRLAVMVRRQKIEATDLAEAVCHENGGAAADGGQQSLSDAVEALERRMIVAALAQCSFNQQQAARALGLSRQGLLNKIKRYAIEIRHA